MGTDNPAVSGEQDAGSEIDILNADDKVEDTKEEVIVEEKEEVKEDEEQELVEEPTESESKTTEDEEEIEDITDKEDTGEEDLSNPSWQLIKEKYPELAKNKDFREIYFRHKTFTEIFSTIESAKDAATKAEQLEVIDKTLADGDIDTIFSNIDTKTLERISTKILPALLKVNENYYRAAAKPLIIDAFHAVMKVAERTGDNNLKKSIRNVSDVLLGTRDLPARNAPSADPSVEEERNKLREDRQRLFINEEAKFLSGANKTIGKRLLSIISEGLDSKNEFNDFTKKSIINMTYADLDAALKKDDGLKERLKQIHRMAARAGFPEEYQSRMIAATLDRARKLVPVLRNKHRTAALGKQSTKTETTKKIVTNTETVKSAPTKVTSVKQIDTRRTSEEDFLNGKFVPRK